MCFTLTMLLWKRNPLLLGRPLLVTGDHKSRTEPFWNLKRVWATSVFRFWVPSLHVHPCFFCGPCIKDRNCLISIGTVVTYFLLSHREFVVHGQQNVLVECESADAVALEEYVNSAAHAVSNTWLMWNFDPNHFVCEWFQHVITDILVLSMGNHGKVSLGRQKWWNKN
jgi:hypothetical protein